MELLHALSHFGHKLMYFSMKLPSVTSVRESVQKARVRRRGNYNALRKKRYQCEREGLCSANFFCQWSDLTLKLTHFSQKCPQHSLCIEGYDLSASTAREKPIIIATDCHCVHRMRINKTNLPILLSFRPVRNKPFHQLLTQLRQ